MPASLTANHLKALSKATQLRALALERCVDRSLRLPEKLLAELAPLENLEYLSLRYNPVTNEDLSPLVKLRKLRGLNLQNANVSNFDALVGLEQLESLSVGWTLRGRDDGVTTGHTTAVSQAVTKLKSLRHLVLDRLYINDACLLEIGKLDLDRLEVLNDHNYFKIGDRDFSDEGLIRFAERQKPKVLLIRGSKYTNEGVEKVRAKLPDCRVIAARP